MSPEEGSVLSLPTQEQIDHAKLVEGLSHGNDQPPANGYSENYHQSPTLKDSQQTADEFYEKVPPSITIKLPNTPQ